MSGDEKEYLVFVEYVRFIRVIASSADEAVDIAYEIPEHRWDERGGDCWAEEA